VAGHAFIALLVPPLAGYFHLIPEQRVVQLSPRGHELGDLRFDVPQVPVVIILR
jgi:hypothetical protein